MRMGRSRHRVLRLVSASAAAAAAAAALALWPAGAGATDYTYTNATNDNAFSTSGNWTPTGGPPRTAADRAILDKTPAGASSYTVNFSSSITIGELRAVGDAGAVTLDFRGFNPTFASTTTSLTVGAAPSDDRDLLLTNSAAALSNVVASGAVRIGDQGGASAS